MRDFRGSGRIFGEFNVFEGFCGALWDFKGIKGIYGILRKFQGF